MEKSTEILCYVYKNAKMGSEAIITLMPKVRDKKLREALTDMLCKYEKYAAEAQKQLTPCGIKPSEEPLMKKLGAKIGIAINTMTDDTSPHIAELLIKGSTMGITDMTKIIREFEHGGCPETALALGRELVSFEQDNIEKLKSFL